MSLLSNFYFKAKGDLQELQFLDLCETDKKYIYRTAAHWARYLDHITTVKYFVFPEKISNLFLHLEV